MKKILFVLMFAFSSIVNAETVNCYQTAIRLATDINIMHKKGATIKDVKRRFNYNEDLAELAAIYMMSITETKPAKGWSDYDYRELAKGFAEVVCEKAQRQE